MEKRLEAVGAHCDRFPAVLIRSYSFFNSEKVG